MKFFKQAIAAAAVLSAVSASAQSSADFDISGTITPVSCTISITGGNHSYGSMSAAYVAAMTASWDDYKSLGTVNRSAAVSCPSAMTFGIAISDPNTAANPLGSGHSTFAVINSANNAGIGYMDVWGAATIDGAAAGTVLESLGVSGTPSWAAYTGQFKSGYTFGVAAASGSTVPSAASAATIDFTAFTYVKQSLVDAEIAAGPVNFAARATFTLRSI